MSRLVWVEIPMRLPSVANQRLHWAAKNRQTKSQRDAVAMALKSFGLRKGVLEGIAELTRGGQLRVDLTRISPRPIKDKHDNLRSAFKGVVDEIANHFGTDDGSEQWDWEHYRQERGRPAVRIEIRIQCFIRPAAIEAQLERRS